MFFKALKYILAMLYSSCNSQPELCVKLIWKILGFDSTEILVHDTLVLPWSPVLGEKTNFTDVENLTGWNSAEFDILGIPMDFKYWR